MQKLVAGRGKAFVDEVNQLLDNGYSVVPGSLSFTFREPQMVQAIDYSKADSASVPEAAMFGAVVLEKARPQAAVAFIDRLPSVTH